MESKKNVMKIEMSKEAKRGKEERIEIKIKNVWRKEKKEQKHNKIEKSRYNYILIEKYVYRKI